MLTKEQKHLRKPLRTQKRVGQGTLYSTQAEPSTACKPYSSKGGAPRGKSIPIKRGSPEKPVTLPYQLKSLAADNPFKFNQRQ